MMIRLFGSLRCMFVEMLDGVILFAMRSKASNRQRIEERKIFLSASILSADSFA
ncbi:MAG: hypothetical protein VX278_09915 [Myxococcota bacterium]|nr:hypothetical protein [Myxococcota bacterium]